MGACGIIKMRRSAGRADRCCQVAKNRTTCAVSVLQARYLCILWS